MPIKSLPVAKLRRVCNPRRLKFKTTAQLPVIDEIIGQPRAVRAIDFGIDVRGPGFNIFVMGPGGTGRMTTVERFLGAHATAEPTPPDWVYVHNFKDPLRPRAMNLPPGRARQFRLDMQALVAFLKTDLPPAFEADDYQRAASQITRELDEARAAAFQQVDTQARARGFTLARADQGLYLAPLNSTDPTGPATPEQIAALSNEQRAALEQAQPDLEDRFNAMMRAVHAEEQHARERLRELDRQTAARTIAPRLNVLIEQYRAVCDEAVEYLEEVRADVVERVNDVRDGDTEGDDAPPAEPAPDRFTRYQVNVLVDQSATTGAPLVVETNPTFMNLVGRIERDVRLGDNALDFTMLRAGALHHANGGYLVLRAPDALKDPGAWEALKRALNTGQIVIEDPGTQLQMFSTRTLESEPIPLNVKVILLGTPWLYYELYDHDEDFHKLFKVKADFATDMDRTPENERSYALFVRARCAEHNLPPFDAGAVAAIIEQGSRLAEDQQKLSTCFGEVADVVIEAAHWARKNHRDVVTAEDVRQALREWRYRSNLIEQQTHESIIDGTIAVQVKGNVIGQINGLSVIDYGDYEFGQPTRISARTYVGRSGVVVIEREAHLSGRIHNKGVLILEGYLGGQYAVKEPLTLAASITFEQSYSEIEGDSASSTELYVLLSALADLPIRQGIAVTGSVDQQGRIQPIGGASAKIEGFFDVCAARGLTGDQGVMIPATNARHLMLREDVLAACQRGEFHIWVVSTIDAGLELLTGVKAGKRTKTGHFPKDSLHARVEAKMKATAEGLDGGKREHDEEDQTDAKKKEDEEETRARRRRKKK
ncbi:MAG TPA: ATP-binding protein [Anaerolineae bacterium]|nr:ATP-binding protein [Anaerolineae bacterium]